MDSDFTKLPFQHLHIGHFIGKISPVTALPWRILQHVEGGQSETVWGWNDRDLVTIENLKQFFICLGNKSILNLQRSSKTYSGIWKIGVLGGIAFEVCVLFSMTAQKPFLFIFVFFSSVFFLFSCTRFWIRGEAGYVAVALNTAEISEKYWLCYFLQEGLR